MKERPIIFSAPMVRALIEGRKTQTRRVLKPQPHRSDIRDDGTLRGHTCPYGVPGDRLWVREAFRIVGPEIVYRAGVGELPGRWKSPFHMPRKFSRIDLEVTSVRAERVRQISCSDCVREGIQDAVPLLRERFAQLWDGINRIKGYPLDDNPWVWVVSFEVIA